MPESMFVSWWMGVSWVGAKLGFIGAARLGDMFTEVDPGELQLCESSSTEKINHGEMDMTSSLSIAIFVGKDTELYQYVCSPVSLSKMSNF